MHVLSGELKGRSLDYENKGVRPTSSKVKEALFSSLGELCFGASFLDLYCGSGAVGIEALSRGALSLTSVDLDARISKRNRKKLSLENWIIFQNDALRAVRMLGKRGVNFDVVFIDPPYSQLEKIEILRECVASDILNIESIVVIETDVKEVLPQEVGPLALAKLASYGQTKLSYYKEKC